jgi:signal transduction histidine kinase
VSEPRDLRRAGLSFFGEVTAGVTHDIRNSLAVLKEIAGLLKDIAEVAGEGGSVASERVIGLAGRLDAQVERANSTVRLLNRFAHSVDHALRSVDLTDTTRLLTDLGRRHAHRHRVELELNLPEFPLSVESDPFLLEHAIFLLLTRTIEEAGTGETVTVTLEAETSGARLKFDGAPRGRVRLRGSVTEIVRMLGGKAVYEDRGDTLVLTVPRRMPGEEDDQDE